VLVHVVVVALPRYLFDHAAEQDEAVVAVRLAAARLELESSLAVQLHVVGECAEFRAMEVEDGAEDVAGATGVGQELVARDLGGDPGWGIR
jgi:hypothetical protein